jgi:hypothetical protein
VVVAHSGLHIGGFSATITLPAGKAPPIKDFRPPP